MQLTNNPKLTSISNSFFILGLILIISFVGPFASDVYLPSLPAMTHSLSITESVAQLTVTAYLFSFGLFQLVYGPLSDHFGRRKILFAGLIVSIIATFFCAFAHNSVQLLTGRFLQGAGIAATAAISRSMMRDTFSGARLIKVNSYISAIFTIAPALAPFLGSYLEAWFSWRAAFVFLLIYLSIIALFMWFLLPETNQNLNPQASSPQIMLTNYNRLLSNKTFMGYLLCSGLSYAGTMAYITISPFLFQDSLGLSVIQYGWVILCVSSSIVISRIFNVLFISRFPVKRVMQLGLSVMLLSGVLLLFFDRSHEISLATVMISIMLYLLGGGLVIPNASACALQPFRDITGSASALYGCLQLLFPFLCTAVIQLFPTKDTLMMAIIFTSLTTTTIIIFHKWISHTDKLLDSKI